jgi:hypothetical protein
MAGGRPGGLLGMGFCWGCGMRVAGTVIGYLRYAQQWRFRRGCRYKMIWEKAARLFDLFLSGLAAGKPCIRGDFVRRNANLRKYGAAGKFYGGGWIRIPLWG